MMAAAGHVLRRQELCPLITFAPSSAMDRNASPHASIMQKNEVSANDSRPCQTRARIPPDATRC